MKHHEFNLLNLEDTSDYESEGPSCELKIDYNSDPAKYATYDNV